MQIHRQNTQIRFESIPVIKWVNQQIRHALYKLYTQIVKQRGSVRPIRASMEGRSFQQVRKLYQKQRTPPLGGYNYIA